MYRTILAFSLAACLASDAVAHSDLRPYPHVGDFYHDGNGYADSLQWTHTPYGGYKSAMPGYEFSFSIDNWFYDACTSWTNLPMPYDDCPTAGVGEPTGVEYTFGVGTYDAKRMTSSGTTYEHRFYLSGGVTDVTGVNIGWQEVEKYFCSTNSIWCMNGVGGGSFAKTQMRYGPSDYISWSH